MGARIISRLWHAILAWDGWYMFPFDYPMPAPWFHLTPNLFTTHCTICVQTESVVNRVI